MDSVYRIYQKSSVNATSNIAGFYKKIKVLDDVPCPFCTVFFPAQFQGVARRFLFYGIHSEQQYIRLCRAPLARAQDLS
jgi:hypothetical protein